jgi:hypothetical protein
VGRAVHSEDADDDPPLGSDGMRWVLGTVLVAGLLAGCGEDKNDAAADASASAAEASASSASAEAEASASAEAEASASAEAEASASAEAEAQAQAEFDRCRRKLAPLVNSLSEIDSRLNVGMNYGEYGDRLGDTQVAYDRTVKAIRKQTPECIDAAVALEDAFNAYLKVYGVWGDCIDDYYCDFSEGVPNDKAQAGWAKATRAIDKAERLLRQMRP